MRVAYPIYRQRARQSGRKPGRDLERGALHSKLRFASEPDRNLFLALGLNETPNRICECAQA
jgi:hypothetical protein